MVNKLLLTAGIMLINIFAYAAMPLCNKIKTETTTEFYAFFIAAHTSFDYAYTQLYQNVDNDLVANRNQKCPDKLANETMTSYLSDEFKTCSESCKLHVAPHWTEAIWFKKTRMQKNIDECVSVCSRFYEAQMETLNN